MSSESAQILSAMEMAVSNMDERTKRKFNATVEFNLTDDGSTHTFVIQPSAAAGKTPTNTLSIKISADTLRALLDKKMTPQQAFMKGKFKVKGKMSLAMKLNSLLEATAKHLKQQTQSRL